MENAIQVRNLTKKYKDFTLDNISFTLPSGTVMGLIGENGAGKSTLINAILGVSDAEYDQVSLLGHDLRTQTKLANALPLFPQLGSAEVSRIPETLSPAGEKTSEKIFHRNAGEAGVRRSLKPQSETSDSG